MSVVDIASAARDILQDAVSGNVPPINVLLGYPVTYPDDVMLFLYLIDPLPDVMKSTGIVRSTYRFTVRLLVRLGGGPGDAEALLLRLYDTVAGAFYQSLTARTLNETAATSQLNPAQGGGGHAFVRIEGVAGEWRTAEWVLEVSADTTYDWR